MNYAPTLDYVEFKQSVRANPDVEEVSLDIVNQIIVLDLVVSEELTKEEILEMGFLIALKFKSCAS